MIARLQHVTYAYPGASAPALSDVNANIEQGAFLLVAGPSAGGKSTFLRVFNGLVPQFYGGAFTGSVEVAGIDPVRTPAREVSNLVGMVFQEPESQAIAETVEDEIAFGMEQQGLPRDEMRRRVDEIADRLGIAHLLHRRVATLSGGERQRVAIAAVLVLRPRLLLLDEPTSQLDPQGAVSVFEALDDLAAMGLTILVSEHRFANALPRASGVLRVRDGAVTSLSPLEAAFELDGAPPAARLMQRLGLPPALTVEDARSALAGVSIRAQIRSTDVSAPGATLLEARGLTVRFGEVTALDGVDLALREGEIVALVGANGSGKSTLFRALTGLAKPDGGEVEIERRPAPAGVADRTAFAGLVPQDPAFCLYHDRVADELGETLRLRGSRGAGELEAALQRWNVAELRDENPRDLSVGQQQRVAIGAMLAHAPRVWLLDEPTRGADHEAKQWLACRLKAHAAAGGAAIVATHDLESAAAYATRVVALEAGRVVCDLPAHVAFGSEGPFATQVARLVPGALLPEDVVPV